MRRVRVGQPAYPAAVLYCAGRIEKRLAFGAQFSL